MGLDFSLDLEATLREPANDDARPEHEVMQCTGEALEFHALECRLVTGRFDGGRISSDAGGVLLREVDKRIGLGRIRPPRVLRRLIGLGRIHIAFDVSSYPIRTKFKSLS